MQDAEPSATAAGDRIRRVVSELEVMADEDQRMRREVAEGTRPWDPEIDRRNTERLKEIVAEFGWPRRSVFGDRAAHIAWLIVQHAPDHEFQRACLKRMKELGPDEVEARDTAYLEDRLRVHEGRPQLYGTQFTWENGELVPSPIEDDARLDERRRSVGLGPFAEYARQIRASSAPQQGRSAARGDPA